MENGKIVIYRTADGETSIDVKLENDTVSDRLGHPVFNPHI